MANSVTIIIGIFLTALLSTGCGAEEMDDEWQDEKSDTAAKNTCPKRLTNVGNGYNGCEYNGRGYYPGAVIFNSKYDMLVKCAHIGGDPRSNRTSAYNWKVADDYDEEGCFEPEFDDSCSPHTSAYGCNYPMQGTQPMAVNPGCIAYGMICQADTHFWAPNR